MNYEWKKIEEHGQSAIGFIERYISKTDKGNILAIVNYLTQFPDSNYEKNVHITLFFEGDKTLITDGFFHYISDDLGEIIKTEESKKFPKNVKKLEYFLMQMFFVEKLPELEYFTHGDYRLER